MGWNWDGTELKWGNSGETEGLESGRPLSSGRKGWEW